MPPPFCPFSFSTQETLIRTEAHGPYVTCEQAVHTPSHLRRVVHVSVALVDHAHSVFLELLEAVRGVRDHIRFDLFTI